MGGRTKGRRERGEMRVRKAGRQRQSEKFNKYYLLMTSSTPGMTLGTGHTDVHTCCFCPEEVHRIEREQTRNHLALKRGAHNVQRGQWGTFRKGFQAEQIFELVLKYNNNFSRPRGFK